MPWKCVPSSEPGDDNPFDAAVGSGSVFGVRWYELRLPGGSPSIFQQGTFQPDSLYRWMGSIAMDRSGDIALGYSVSSSGMHPAIRYTGRLNGDPLGQILCPFFLARIALTRM